MSWKANKQRNGRWSWKATAVSAGKVLRKLMNSTKHALMIILCFLIVKGKKHYVMPNVRTIQIILKERYGICVGLRWIFQCLKDLQDAGLIWRKRRWNLTDPTKPKSFSSLIGLTASGVMYSQRFLIAGAEELWQRLIAWWRRKDGRAPSESELTGRSQKNSTDSNLARMREMYAKIGNGPAGGRTPATT